MLELHYGPGACSFVPHVGLEVIKAATGEDFVAHAVKLHKGEQHSPEYLAINPNGQVPTLVVDGKSLSQIIAICDYLDRRFPQAGLLPTDAWARAQALSQFAWMNNTVHTTFTHIFKPEKFCEGGEETKAEIKRVNVALYRKHLERIQSWTASAAPYWLGARLSFLDAYALTLLRWGRLAEIDADSLPAYKAYVDRVAAHPAVAAAMAREGIQPPGAKS